MRNSYLNGNTITNSRLNPEYNVGYITDAVRVKREDQLLRFPGTKSARAMAINKVNTTLSCLLIGAIFVSAISYFFVVSSEIKLNECSRQTAILNVENSELENKLDKLKSFNNVDLTMQKSNLLQRPEKVIEATEVKVNSNNIKKTDVKPKTKAWAIGY